jgi:SAM-dependent methyltransferase
MKIDFDYAYDHPCYRPKFPEELFDRLAQKFGIGKIGQRVLDLGTGSGTMARAFARRGCVVTGLDSEPQQIEDAKRMVMRHPELGVTFVVGRAEATGLRDAAFEVVAAGQCWHWFDGRAAAREARRVVVPGGFLLIVYLDWVAQEGNVADITETLIEKHNPAWRFRGWSGFNPLWMNDVAAAGFSNIESSSFDMPVLYSHEYWRERVRDSAGVGASLSAEQVQRFDDELNQLLRERFPTDPLSVPHRSYSIVARAPA